MGGKGSKPEATIEEQRQHETDEAAIKEIDENERMPTDPKEIRLLKKKYWTKKRKVQYLIFWLLSLFNVITGKFFLCSWSFCQFFLSFFLLVLTLSFHSSFCLLPLLSVFFLYFFFFFLSSSLLLFFSSSLSFSSSLLLFFSSFSFFLSFFFFSLTFSMKN